MSIDKWQNKMRRLRKCFKGWNFNVEGIYMKKKKKLLREIDEIDKKIELFGLNNLGRNQKAYLETELTKLLREE